MTSSADYVGLGPCVQDPAWVKMSSPTPTSAPKKQRKKPEAKPQSQINKCLNEKRRREQENIYIEELAELIQASIVSDMNSLNSVKPDKCAILQQTVDKIKQIKEAEASGEEAVQQGEVSSSRQTLLQNQLLGPLVLEALDGFLFLVTTTGRIEFVSENVSQYIKFAPEDLCGELIYDIVHAGDHKKLSNSFDSVGWANDPALENSRSRSFTCRLLVKATDETEETMDDKQSRVPLYEPMQISAVLSSNYLSEKACSEGASSEGDRQQFLACIARRIPTTEPQGTPVEQFTTMLDKLGLILDIDISGISSKYSQYLTKDLVRKNFGDVCHSADYKKFATVLRDTLKMGHSTSQVYRLKFAERCIHIQTKCKFFHNNHEDSFIMATHSVISSYQEGVTNSNSVASSASPGLFDESLALTANQGELTPDFGSASSTADNRQLRLLLTQVADGVTDDDDEVVGEPDSELSLAESQQNKILKGLLDQKDEDDSTNAAKSLLNRICAPGPTKQHPQNATGSASTGAKPSQSGLQTNHIQDGGGKNNPGNHMLRELLNDKSDDDSIETQIKKEKDALLFDILGAEEPVGGLCLKDEKISIKQEFLTSSSALQSSSPANSGAGPSSSLSPPGFAHSNAPPSFSMPGPSPFASSPSAVHSSASMSFSSGNPKPPSRPSSVELPGPLSSSVLRGVKRPSEDATHDGNPSKQSVGGFESLLVGSPNAVLSPVSGAYAGPPTPLGRSSTPLGRPNTPHSAGSLTPQHAGTPGTPHGRPPTPHGPHTPIGMAAMSLGSQNPSTVMGGSGNQGIASIAIGAQSVPPGSSCNSVNSIQQQHLQQQQLQQHQQHQQMLHHQMQQQQQHLQGHQQQLHPQQVQQVQSSGTTKEKNKMLLRLLQTQSIQAQPPATQTGTLKPLTSPYSLPQEKLPKNLNEKLNPLQHRTTWNTTTGVSGGAQPLSVVSSGGVSVPSSGAANAQSSEILNQLLRQPPNNTRPTMKLTMGGVSQLRHASHPGQDSSVNVMQQQQQQQQHQQQLLQLQHNQMASQIQSRSPQNVLGAINSLDMNQVQIRKQGVVIPVSSGALSMNQVSMAQQQQQQRSLESGSQSVSSISSSSIPGSQTSTTTTLPPFSDSMGVNIFGGAVSSSSYPDGPLPSITSATSSFASQENLNNDLHDIVMQVLLDLQMSTEVDQGSTLSSSMDELQASSSCGSGLPFDVNENFAIQRIKKELMSGDFEAQGGSPGVAGNIVPSMSPYSGAGNTPSTSMGQYPPPYNPRGRHPGTMAQPGSVPNANMGPGPVGSVSMRQGGPIYPGSTNMQGRTMAGQQRISQQLTPQQQEQMKQRLLQRQQNQVLVPSSTSDGSTTPHTPTSGGFQNFDDIINSSVAPNQRNPSEQQSSPNYGLMNSPVGSAGGGQMSPGQRISQPPFSPANPIGSPLPTSQIYSTNSGMGQMGSYPNAQGAQLSPRLSQGSPGPQSFQGPGVMLPQVSPTGHNPSSVQVAQGQQSPAWTGSSPQHRSMQQNQMMANQMGIMGPGSRNFGGGRTVQLPSIRGHPNQGPRQNPYAMGGSQPTGGSSDLGGFASSSPQQAGSQMMYQQQQQQQHQQQYRFARSMSAHGPGPGQMQGVHPVRGSHFHLGHPGAPIQHPGGAQIMGAHYNLHSGPTQSNMGQLVGSMESVPPMMGMVGMTGGGMMGQGGYGGDVPQTGGSISHSFDGASNCFGAADTQRSSSVAQVGTSGMINERTRKELMKHFEARNASGAMAAGSVSPSLIQQSPQRQQSQGAQLTTRPIQTPPQSGGPIGQQQQGPTGFQSIDSMGQQQQQQPHMSMEQSMLNSFSPTGDGGGWAREGGLGGINPQQSPSVGNSPRVEEMRGPVANTGGGAEKEKSMLKKLLSQ